MEESHSEIPELIVIKDNALVHKKIYIEAYKRLNWVSSDYPSNFPDFNPTENIWAWMKHVITSKYKYVSSKIEMMRIVQSL